LIVIGQSMYVIGDAPVVAMGAEPERKVGKRGQNKDSMDPSKTTSAKKSEAADGKGT